jgi:hypothetical protein
VSGASASPRVLIFLGTVPQKSLSGNAARRFTNTSIYVTVGLLVSLPGILQAVVTRENRQTNVKMETDIGKFCSALPICFFFFYIYAVYRTVFNDHFICTPTCVRVHWYVWRRSHDLSTRCTN